MNINDLDSFSPKQNIKQSKPINPIKPLLEAELDITTKISNPASEFQSYGNIEIKTKVLEESKTYEKVSANNNSMLDTTNVLPIIDLYILSRNCSEYIKLNNIFERNLQNGNHDNNFLFDNKEIAVELSKREYIKSIFKIFSLGSLFYTFETNHYIFKDNLFFNYQNYFPFKNEENLILNIFIPELNTSGIQAPELINKIDIENKEVKILKIINQEYYNYEYCNYCIFKKNCTRRNLIS